MLRIRRSFLESFRRVVETDYGSEEELARDIRGEPTEMPQKVHIGTAWHWCLEHNGTLDVDHLGHVRVPVNGETFTFRHKDVALACDVMGWGTREMPGELEIRAGGRRVLLTARADHIAGLTVTDHKTTLDAPDLSDYEEALQWRVYLLVHRMQRFRYLIWQFRGPDKSGLLTLRAHSEANFYPYEGMELDVIGWVERFLDWADARDLTQHLERGDDHAVPA